eukprot:PITA_25326
MKYQEILKACHDGPCGGHFADKRIAYKVLLLGYYWPCLFKDAKEYLKRCDSYQRMGKPIPLDEMPLQPQEYKIKHQKSTPYHPWANGKVESTNKVIEAILTRTVHLHRRDWVEKLPEDLWPYRTTWRNTTGHTPYELVYGKQVLFPIELWVKTFKPTMKLGLDISEAQKQRMIRHDVIQRTNIIQQQRSGWHDKYIKERKFQPRDWALLFDPKFKDFQGKFQTHWLGPYEIETVIDNGVVKIRTIDEEIVIFLVNGHRLRIYHKPLTKEEFVKT